MNRNSCITKFFKLPKYKLNLFINRHSISTCHMYNNFNKSFCTKNNNENFKRYNHDFESPENHEFNLKTIIERVSIFLIKVFSTSLMIYFIFFKKYNEISKEREIYFLNESCENWLATKLSQRLQCLFNNLIFKEDSIEVVRVNKIFTELLEKNKIKVITKNVFVLKLPNIGCFLLKNGDLFISSSLLDLAKNDEQIAFMIAHEISIIIHGKFFLRIIKSYINHMFFNSFIGIPFTQGGYKSIKVDYTQNKLADHLKLNFFLNFYPENPNLTYFEHVIFFNVTIKLLKNADYSLIKVIQFITLVNRNFKNS